MNKEVRPRTSIIVSNEEASEFLKSASPVLENDPARYYELLLSSSNYTGYTIRSELIDFYLNLKSDYINPIAILGGVTTKNSPEMISSNPPPSAIEKNEETSSNEEKDSSSDSGENIKENLTPNLYGIAVFSGNKMVGELTNNETIAHLLLTNSLRFVNLDIEDIKDKNELTTITLTQKNKPKIKVKIINNVPQIDIKIDVNAKLNSNAVPIDYNDEENRAKLTNKIKEKIEYITNEYLEKTSREFESDIVGFGKFLKINYPTLDELEKAKWLDLYKLSKFNLEVNINLDTTQIVSNSQKFKE